jgi:hypothetical protein
MRPRKKSANPPYVPLENYDAADNRVLLTAFEGPGGITFDQIVATLKSGDIRLNVTIRTKNRTVRGVTLEMDESGIVRIGHPLRSGVRVLVWREGDCLFGEFVD